MSTRSFSFEWGWGFLFPLSCIVLITVLQFRWLEGLALTAAFFGSVLAHEAGHLLVAKANGAAVTALGCNHRGVYLRREKAEGTAEFAISAAGPAVNLVLALLLFSYNGDWSWLAKMNGFLFVLNMLPIAGSDGQRILLGLRERRAGAKALVASLQSQSS
jgi:Zn-dependent protease